MKTIHIKTYKDLIVWEKAMELVTEIYKLTAFFPQSERYGLIQQMRKAALSIPSNIAEGRRRGSRKEFRYFLFIAFGSGSELETQIEISKRLQIGKPSNYEKIDKLLDEVMRMLNRLTTILLSPPSPTTYNLLPTT